MSDVSEKAARQDRLLAEFSELSLVVARELSARVVAVGDAGEAATLAKAFHSVGRSLRQTIALEMKVERDRKHLEREDAGEVARQGELRVRRRKARLRSAVQRLVWTEHEGDEAEVLIDHLDDLLAEDALDDAFANEDFDAQVARLRDDLGLAMAAVDVEPPNAPFLSRVAGEGDRPPQSGGWRGQASSPDFNTS
jgi:hypothetical protein